MDNPITLIPYRENRSVKATVAPAVIAFDDATLPTEHPVGAYLARLSMGSRDTMQRGLACALCAVGEGVQLAEVDSETSRFYHQQVWVAEWQITPRPWMLFLYPALEIAGYAPYTRQRIVTAVRGVLKECRFMGLMDGDDYFQLTENMPKISADAPPAGRAVDPDEYLGLLEVCDQDPKRSRGVRDGAILSLGHFTGPRAGEVARLRMPDYSPQLQLITFRVSKNNKTRNVPFFGDAARRMDEWLAIRGNDPGRIFCQLDTAGNVRIRNMRTGVRRLKPITTGDTINDILQYRIVEAGLVDSFTFHDFRRTAATEVSRVSGIELAQRILGHSSLSTTGRYRIINDQEVREAMAKRDIGRS